MFVREIRVSVFADCYLNGRVNSLFCFFYVFFFKHSISVVESQVSQEDTASPGTQECKYISTLFSNLFLLK